MTPYIGVTGFMTEDEVRAALGALPSKCSRLLMVGVLASSKTLRGETNNHPGRYPKIAHIDTIFVDDARALNLIHFASDSPDRLASELERLLMIGGKRLGGFQLNVTWPEPNQLYPLADKNMRVVLQIGKHAMEKCKNDTRAVCDRVAAYEGRVTDVLIDGSGGRGALFSPTQAGLMVAALAEAFPALGIGVAGGLYSATLPLIQDVTKLFPQLSIDAEGRLRDEHDCLDRLAVASYLEAAVKILA